MQRETHQARTRAGNPLRQRPRGVGGVRRSARHAPCCFSVLPRSWSHDRMDWIGGSSVPCVMRFAGRISTRLQ